MIYNPTAPAAEIFTRPAPGACPSNASVPPGVSEDASGRFPSVLRQLRSILPYFKDARTERQQLIMKNISDVPGKNNHKMGNNHAS